MYFASGTVVDEIAKTPRPNISDILLDHNLDYQDVTLLHI
jgi:hypothetical protein